MTLMLTMLLAVAVAACVGTAVLRSRAHAWGLVDVPNERSLHSRVTPRGGGIVVVGVTLAGLLVLTIAERTEPPAGVLVFVLATLLVAGIGWRDDVRSLPPMLKFAAHFAAAVLAILTWGAFDRLQLPGTAGWGVGPAIAIVITAVWLAGLINAYNFMDGIDGIAAGQAVIAGSFWAWAINMVVPFIGVLGLLVAFACLGFLWHNRPPAKVFLGDAGSGFLGFTFAVLPLIAYQNTGDPRLPVAGVLIVWPFVFDTAFTLARRLGRGENIVLAHRSHLYQRLVLSGWTHGRVTAVYLALAILFAVATALWLDGATAWVLAGPLALTGGLVPLVGFVEGRARRR